jgi:hypothetical protein
MEVRMMALRKKPKNTIGHGVYHPGARPMKVFLDDNRCTWLCDKDTDPDKGLEKQGCWRCSDLAFTRND